MDSVDPHAIRGRSRQLVDAPDVKAMYEAEYPSIVRTVHLIVHDRAAAEDITQDAFVQLLRHWAKVSRYDEPGAWLRRVAIRMAVREAKRSHVRVLREREAVTAEGAAAPATDTALMSAIRELSPRQRAVVVLFYLEDRPMDQIAALLGCSTSTGFVHLHRARRQLAVRLGEEVADDVD